MSLSEMEDLNAIISNVGDQRCHQKWGTSTPSPAMWGTLLSSAQGGGPGAIVGNGDPCVISMGARMVSSELGGPAWWHWRELTTRWHRVTTAATGKEGP